VNEHEHERRIILIELDAWRSPLAYIGTYVVESVKLLSAPAK